VKERGEGRNESDEISLGGMLMMHDRRNGWVGTKSIGGTGRSWSGRTTESSLSLRNKLGWCLISCLQFERMMEVIHLQEEIWHAGLCEVVGLECDRILAEKDPCAVRLQCLLKCLQAESWTNLRSQKVPEI